MSLQFYHKMFYIVCVHVCVCFFFPHGMTSALMCYQSVENFSAFFKYEGGTNEIYT